MTTLNLNTVVDVIVEVSPASAPREEFNQMLIVGNSKLISPDELVIPTSERIRQYTDTDSMLSDGFVDTDPEYLAAQIYFGQTPAPQIVWIGCCDTYNSETIVESVEACRAANADWYQVNVDCLTPADSDLKSVAAYIESATPSSLLAYTTSSSDVLTPSITTDIMGYLKALSYERSIGQYSTTLYAIAAIMGYANGQNTGLANSAYTLFAKQEKSVIVESLTYNQKQIIEGKNGNVYVNYANYYNWFEPGKMANGYFYDQVVNRDMLVNNLQLSVADLLNQNPKIPQTEAGATMIHNALSQACQLAVSIGYLAAGTYTGIPFLNLNTGDAMPNGYVIQSEPVSQQSSADRALRKSVPFYITIKESGAVQSCTILVNVNI